MNRILARVVATVRRWNSSPVVRQADKPSGAVVAGRVASLVARILVGTLALVGLLSIGRGTPIGRLHTVGRASTFPAAGSPAHRRLSTLLAGVTMTGGNRVEILADGDETYPRLWADLRGARTSITMQMYYALPGKVADSVATILREQARAGVRVHLLLDAFGSQDLTGAWADSVRASGAAVTALRPMRWYTLDRAGRRSHVRAVVVDGAIGYTGGFGIADYWLGDGHTDDAWRETNVRFTGPEVARLQAAFMAAWAEATGDLVSGDAYFPAVATPVTGGGHASLVYTTPSLGSTVAERLLATTIASARRTLYITNAYFLPDDDFRRFLQDARRRGVDVRVLTASTKTDIKSVYFASRNRYEPLLRAGIRIFEYQPSMIHAKTVVVDGTWSLVGSMNFDNRSLALNDEANLVSSDPNIARTLDSLFASDLRHSREITLTEFARRPWWHRILENGAALLSRVL